MTRTERQAATRALATRLAAATNAELVAMNLANLPDYDALGDLVDDPTYDRMCYAREINNADISGDTDHRFLCGAPKAWLAHN